MTSQLGELRDRWMERRDELRHLKANVDGATLCDRFLADLEGLSTSPGTATVTLGQAAQLSGYSRDHLSRLLRQGKLTNAGRKHQPRLLTDELPKRPNRRLEAKPKGSYDAATDARSLGARR